MIAPKTCACGEAMQWRSGHRDLLAIHAGAYACHHCDEPCAGVASNVACSRCDRMKVKR